MFKIALNVFLCLAVVPSLWAADLNTELYLAARRGDMPMVNDLIKKGAEPDAPIDSFQKWSPMMAAAFEGNVEVIDTFIRVAQATSDEDKSAIRDANETTTRTYNESVCGETALNLGVEQGYVAVVKKLLDYGFPINHPRKNGATPLMLAVGNGQMEMVQLLLDYGADINKKHMCGMTPLMEAAKKGYMQVVQALLDKGADIFAQDNAGMTAFMFADKRGNTAIAQLLLEKSNALAQAGKNQGQVVSLIEGKK